MYKSRLFFIISILLHILVLTFTTLNVKRKQSMQLPNQITKITFITNNKKESTSQKISKISSIVKKTSLQKEESKTKNIIYKKSEKDDNHATSVNKPKSEIKNQKIIQTEQKTEAISKKIVKPNITNIQRVENPNSANNRTMNKKNIKPQKVTNTKVPTKKQVVTNTPAKQKPQIKSQQVNKQNVPKKKPNIKKQGSVKKDIAKKPIENKKNIENNDFASILENVKQTIKTTPSDTKSHEFEDEYSLSSNMIDSAISEKDIIKTQIESSWKSPVIVDINIQSVKIHLFIEINIDGSLKNLKITKIDCPYGKKDLCNTLADSTINAVYSATPFKGLTQENYHLWKEFDLIFDPSFMTNH